MATLPVLDNRPVPDPLANLRDPVAVQDEHSHVDRETRIRIGELILAQGEAAGLDATARALAAQLSTDELAAIVADWLDAQIAV